MAQLQGMFSKVNTSTQTGIRDLAIQLLLLDTGTRCDELINLKLEDTNLENRTIKIWGKGSRERVIPIGARCQSALWKYINLHRPEPYLPSETRVFLTWDGRPLTKDRLGDIVARYGEKAGITGVRASPHTFRHTMGTMFLRNHCDIYSLQRILGHSTLDMVKVYLNLAQSDIDRAHRKASPADNLNLNIPQTRRRGPQK